MTPPSLDADAANVMRQALAGMLWSKQFYYYDVDQWLEEHGVDPFKATRKAAPRNDHWHHMYNADIISMPDKWEYPWYAAWDLAFHVLAADAGGPGLRQAAAGADAAASATSTPTARSPPTSGTSATSTRRSMPGPPSSRTAWIRRSGGRGPDWLKSGFHKLLLNFTWWVNRKDRSGRNVFEGGFLGLDNIGVFDRSAPLPTGGYLEQADGTAWMALFCQNMLEIASELALDRPGLRGPGHQVLRALLLDRLGAGAPGGDTGMWDEEDGFFYDVLRLPDGRAQRLKVRSMVGLLPLCAATVFEGELLERNPQLAERIQWFLETRPELCTAVHDPRKVGVAGRRLAAILDETKLRRVLAKMLDENEFLSPYGLRSLSRYHADHPYVFYAGGQEYRVSYLPAESDTGMFGGNSNWRGPIWMPVNALIIRALLQYYTYYGNEFTVECPTGSGRQMNLYQVAEEITRRLAGIFLRERKAGARSTAARTSSRTTRTGATTSCSTSTSTATTGPASARATRPAGPGSSPGSCTCSRLSGLRMSLNVASRHTLRQPQVGSWGRGEGRRDWRPANLLVEKVGTEAGPCDLTRAEDRIADTGQQHLTLTTTD